MKTLIEAPFLLSGDEMKLARQGYVLIDHDTIAEVGTGSRPQAEKTLRCEHSIIIPGLINSHIHLGDSAFKDAGSGKTLDELFKPPNGLKHKLLKAATRSLLLEATRHSLADMLRSGTTTFADFREGSIEGARILLETLREHDMRGIIFGRTDYNFSLDQLNDNKGTIPNSDLTTLHELLEMTQGIAPSSPNDATDAALKQLAEIATQHQRMKVTHAVENPHSEKISRERSGLTEVERAVRYLNVDLLVHLTYASQEDMNLVAARDIPVAVCSRANACLSLKLPPIKEMLDRGITVCIGTDNVMLNQPDMFREMEFTFKAYRIEKTATRHLRPIEVLRMATINGAKGLRIDHKTGSIAEGKSADLVIIDLDKNLRDTKDLLTSLVHRTAAEDISSVIVRGKIAYDNHMGNSREST
jgi:cytosine/adenosine deaminase-related metal-dependent hydrolase